jgi:hypothetical protein
MFMREAMIGSFGHRPKSSSRLALELAAKDRRESGFTDE